MPDPEAAAAAASQGSREGRGGGASSDETRALFSCSRRARRVASSSRPSASPPLPVAGEGEGALEGGWELAMPTTTAKDLNSGGGEGEGIRILRMGRRDKQEERRRRSEMEGGNLGLGQWSSRAAIRSHHEGAVLGHRQEEGRREAEVGRMKQTRIPRARASHHQRGREGI